MIHVMRRILRNNPSEEQKEPHTNMTLAPKLLPEKNLEGNTEDKTFYIRIPVEYCRLYCIVPDATIVDAQYGHANKSL